MPPNRKIQDDSIRAAVHLQEQVGLAVVTDGEFRRSSWLLQTMGHDPPTTSVHTLFLAGEPALAVEPTRRRIENLWDARIVEFYGCTEASPHVGGYSCPAQQRDTVPAATHLMEDVQIWEVVILKHARASQAAGGA